MGKGGNDTLKGEAGYDELYGGNNDDDLDGGADADHLYGGDGKFSMFDGDDILNGGDGNDILEGGTGSDRYIFTGNFGRDIIKDSDELGSIEIGGVPLSPFNQSATGSIIYYDNLTNPTKKAIVIDEGNTKSLMISTVTIIWRTC